MYPSVSVCYCCKHCANFRTELYSQVPSDRSIPDAMASVFGCQIEQSCRNCGELVANAVGRTQRPHPENRRQASFVLRFVKCVSIYSLVTINGSRHGYYCVMSDDVNCRTTWCEHGGCGRVAMCIVSTYTSRIDHVQIVHVRTHTILSLIHI